MVYQITDANDTEVYYEGTAEEILSVLVNNGVKFIDADKSRLHIRLA